MSPSPGQGQPSEGQHSMVLAKQDAVRKAAESRLRESSYAALRLVKCDFHEGVLIFRGNVPTYHQKQVAQSLLQSLEGVLEVSNRLEVGPVSGSPRKPR